jgi:hypothetical protein
MVGGESQGWEGEAVQPRQQQQQQQQQGWLAAPGTGRAAGVTSDVGRPAACACGLGAEPRALDDAETALRSRHGLRK